MAISKQPKHVPDAEICEMCSISLGIVKFLQGGKLLPTGLLDYYLTNKSGRLPDLSIKNTPNAVIGT